MIDTLGDEPWSPGLLRRVGIIFGPVFLSFAEARPRSQLRRLILVRA